MSKNVHSVGLLVLLASATALAPVASSDLGGGTVADVAPSVERLASGATEVNLGDSSLFEGTVRDKNKQADLVELRMTIVSGPTSLTVTHAITAAEKALTAEPTDFGADGFKVWSHQGNNGKMDFKFRYTYGAVGVYDWRVLVRDEGTFQSDPDLDVRVDVLSVLAVHAQPVNAAGAPQVGVAWGAWNAEPGASNVSSLNYIKVVNTGLDDDQRMLLDFTPTAFAGVASLADSIAIDGNIQFAWWEDATPSSTAPLEPGATYTFGTTSSDGSMAARFTGSGNVIYVQYRIVAVPDVIADQAYQAAYTVTPF